MITKWDDGSGNQYDRISANGSYYLNKANLDIRRPFTFGGSKIGAGAGATVQLWHEVGGARVNLDAAQTITTATAKAWPNEYTLNGKRGITVTGLNGTDDVLTMEVGQ